MDDFAMKLLGTPEALDLPLMGKELEQNEVGWGLKRRRKLADVRSPVGGVITEVNAKARENSRWVNDKPYEDGWLFMLRTPDVKRTVKDLMADTESLDWMNGEVGRLEAMIEEVGGPLATDGGHLARDIYGNFPKLGWEKLTKAFLKT
jgi:glycine cleavage system H lipoate-binding protein